METVEKTLCKINNIIEDLLESEDAGISLSTGERLEHIQTLIYKIKSNKVRQ